MKRTLIYLLVAVALLVVAGAGLWFLNGYEPTEDASSQIASQPMASLYKKKADAKVNSVQVKSAAGSFKVVADDEVYGIDGFETAHLMTADTASIAKLFDYIGGEAVEGAANDLAQFGLNPPAATLTADISGEIVKVLVGNKAPGSSARYTKLEGNDTVVLMYGADTCVAPANDFVTLSVTPAKEQTLPTLVRFGGTVRGEKPLEIATRKATEAEAMMGQVGMTITSHGNKPINYDRAAEPLAALFGITATAVEAYKPTADTLKELGLSEPYSTVYFEWQEEKGKASASLRCTKPENGEVLLMRDDLPVIYRVSAESVPWLALQYQDVVTRLVVLPFIKDLKKITVTGSGVNEEYRITINDEDDINVADKNGRKIETDVFQKFYQSLVGIPAEQYTDTPPEEGAKMRLTITYEYADGRTSDVVELVQGPVLQVYIKTNGETEFLTNDKYLEVVLENITKLAKPDVAASEINIMS